MGIISAQSKVTYNWLGQISQHIPQISSCMNTNQNNNKQTNKFNADSWSNHYSCKHQPSPPVERKCSVKTNKKCPTLYIWLRDFWALPLYLQTIIVKFQSFELKFSVILFLYVILIYDQQVGYMSDVWGMARHYWDKVCGLSTGTCLKETSLCLCE